MPVTHWAVTCSGGGPQGSRECHHQVEVLVATGSVDEAPERRRGPGSVWAESPGLGSAIAPPRVSATLSTIQKCVAPGKVTWHRACWNKTGPCFPAGLDSFRMEDKCILICSNLTQPPPHPPP